MAFDPHLPTRSLILGYFAERLPSVAHAAEQFFANPTFTTGRALLRCYFQQHQVGDIESLRLAVASFADKRLVRGIVQSILEDDAVLEQIAAKSYPHPIGFDKLVLDDDRSTGFKFRLHVYWRGANFAALERLHLHRFEMASAIITGELTNHLWHVVDYQPANLYLPAMDCKPRESINQQVMAAYSGYRRDAAGQLRKTYLGECHLERGPSQTFTSGDAYAQLLEDAHFVETNAETGFANGDFCSTIYVHGPSRCDQSGRALPVLFEDEPLANDDQIISTIPALAVDELRQKLTRYRDTLDEILRFYDWLYDPKHGRNLSTGMIAGYLLCEAFQTPHAIEVFERQYPRCKDILERHEQAVRACINGEWPSDDDRNARYIRLLAAKALAHPAGPQAWLAECGSLTKEMWRYFGAIRGEAGDTITVLKPIWEKVVQRKLPGGMHHGHIAAMIEAVFDANQLAMTAFNQPINRIDADDYHVTTQTDVQIDQHIKQVLQSHFPSYQFDSEETQSHPTNHHVGARRFLVDPIDGTRNFVELREEFAISIACQEYTATGWQTTDAVVSHPPTGKIFWAERDHGAFIIDRHDQETRLCVSRPEQRLKGALVDFSATGLGIPGQVKVFHQLLEAGAKFRNGGSVGLMLARLAGRGGTASIITANDHDVEAGKLIATEAGAKTVQFNINRPHGPVTVTLAAINQRLLEQLHLIVNEHVA